MTPIDGVIIVLAVVGWFTVAGFVVGFVGGIVSEIRGRRKDGIG